MEWFFFLFMAALWFYSLFQARQEFTLARTALFVGVSLIFGLMLSTGISFPNGFTSTTVGSTTTQVVSYTVYTATLSGANAFPPLFGLSWLLIILGVLGLIYLFWQTFQQVMNPEAKPIRWY